MMQDVHRLDLIAETQIVLDAEVARCWELVRAGIQRGLLDLDRLRALTAALRAGNAAFGDLAFERDASGERLRVSLGADQRACTAAVLVAELEQLVRRAEASAARADEPPDLRAVLTGLIGVTSEQLVEHAPDLEASLRALGIDPARATEAVRAIATWLEQRTPAAGAEVDRQLAELEAVAAPYFGEPREPDATRDRRLRERARASISASVAASVAARIKPPSR